MARVLFENIAIFDGTGTPPYRGEVLVDGQRIAAVAKSPAPLPRAGATVVDARSLPLWEFDPCGDPGRNLPAAMGARPTDR